MDVKLGAIIDKLETVGSSSLLKEGTFNLTVTTDLPLSDASGTSLTSVSTNIELVEDTPLEVFVQDVTYFEDDASPLMKVYLNRAHTEDVTITYDVAAAGTDTATSGSDFTGQSAQTISILKLIRIARTGNIRSIWHLQSIRHMARRRGIQNRQIHFIPGNIQHLTHKHTRANRHRFTRL